VDFVNRQIPLASALAGNVGRHLLDDYRRKHYLATEAGKAALTEALAKVRELMNAVEDQSHL
jgi:hypothetical protein